MTAKAISLRTPSESSPAWSIATTTSPQGEADALLIDLARSRWRVGPAMGAMILNMSSNVLGLGNAATPFGIRAMQHLDALNPVKGTASNAMVLFLAINTSSVTLLPTGVIALRAAAGSADPAGILPTTLFATFCSTGVAIVMAKVCQRWWPMPAGGIAPEMARPVGARAAEPDRPDPEVVITDESGAAEAARGYPAWASGAALCALALLVPLTIFAGRARRAPLRTPAAPPPGPGRTCATRVATLDPGGDAAMSISWPSSSPSRCCARAAPSIC